MTGAPLRAVADCVVYAQALLSAHGPAATCLRYAREGKLRLFLSGYVIQEVLELPAKLDPRRLVTPERVSEFLRDVASFAETVSAVPAVVPRELIDDVDDLPYVDLALATDSALIVSWDDHLRRGRFLARYPQLRVLTPPELLAELRRQEPPRS